LCGYSGCGLSFDTGKLRLLIQRLHLLPTLPLPLDPTPEHRCERDRRSKDDADTGEYGHTGVFTFLLDDDPCNLRSGQ